MKRLTHDFETRSACDLKKSGAYKYSLDPTTQPTCLAFKVHHNDQMYFLDFDMGNSPWKDLSPKLRVLWWDFIKKGYEFSAHNSFFERCIYDNILVKRYGWPEIDPRKRRCTAAKAAACALPRSLEGAGQALKLPIQKDKGGYAPMMATCKPTKKYNAWLKSGKGERPRMFLAPEDDPETWLALYRYCKIDVRAEELVDLNLPDLSPKEQEVWFLNQEINWRGLQIDLEVTQKIIDIMEVESKKKLKELDTLTMGLVTKPGARKSILEFLAIEGIELPDIRAKTVQDQLEGFVVSDDARRLLEIRKALSKTSTRKYQSFLHRASKDNRVRDIQLYHGASTGRDSGSGIQIQNFPRPLIKQKDIEHVIECLQEKDFGSIVNWIECLYGNSSFVFSSLLRSMILPTKEHELFVADFSKIEVAVLWWLADNAPGLRILKAGKDPYIYQASANTGKKYEDVTEDERQLGKAQVLGCGFGMGASKFQATAWDMYRLKLSDEESLQAVRNYRQTNAAVPGLWKKYEDAACSVVEKGEGIIHAGMCEFKMQDKFLWVRLPSGRKLAYNEPRLSWRESDYGPRRTLEFWAVNSKTKKWGLERTWGGTLTENIVQAVARDLLMYGALRCEKAGYRVNFSVHDELICERPKAVGSVEDYVKILCKPPEWAKGLPIEAKGWQGPRYRK